MAQQEARAVTLPTRHKNEVNKLIEENNRFKTLIRDLDSEVKCMKIVE